jgi:excisionase family DNA binding protein
MALRKSAALSTDRASPRGRGNVYSAQTLADFCEVDLKTVHHWAERGKVPHHRTDGRHLRFRRNDVVRFLRAHGYPLPEALVHARPSVALALGAAILDGAALSLDELAKRLGSRFSVRRHPNGVAAIAHLVSESPDVLVIALDDPTIGFPQALAALKEDPSTAWICVVAIGADEALPLARSTGAEVALTARDVAKLTGELARALAVT